MSPLTPPQEAMFPDAVAMPSYSSPIIVLVFAGPKNEATYQLEINGKLMGPREHRKDNLLIVKRWLEASWKELGL